MKFNNPYETMELYIVQFYDHNESGGVEHNELYSTRKAAERRFKTLRSKLNCYSWVSMYETRQQFGRIRQGKRIADCSSCYGDDDYYHGDDSDF